MSEPASGSALPYIGGQAVIEGVMMRGPACVSVAVRRPDGQIVVREGPLRSRLSTSRFWKLPGARGLVTLVESLTIGWSALRFSAEQQASPEDREVLHGKAGTIATVIPVIFAIALFIALPQFLASASLGLAHIPYRVSDTRFHIVIGIFKLLILLTYLIAISRIPDVRRVFQYHGAEHKTINAYESGLALTVENVRAQTTLHPRCGTTFLVVVVVISVVLGSTVVPMLLPAHIGASGHILTLAIRIALLPLVAAISYELQRLTAKFCTRGWLRALLWPGFLFQKITTREPEDDQIEIAIAAMKTAEWREAQGAASTEQPQLLVFETFQRFVSALPTLRLQ